MLAQIVRTHSNLTEQYVATACEEAFEKLDLNNKKLLFIIPDNSRTTPMDLFFRVVYRLLADRVKILDFLVALGTHPQLSENEIYQRVGLDAELHRTMYQKARFFNHHYDDPRHIVSFGIVPADFVRAVSNGLMNMEINVTINKMILEYDMLMIIGPTFPHEVVGFSGGNKYFFPGIAGQEIIDASHWLGALITNNKINGIKDTPVR
ncbi:DUF2088 domain-containing protein, partial [candidate division KSB1 bacterium]|nr:DUF2088 domain-containing protein [candidate division KSB1 bacterium]